MLIKMVKIEGEKRESASEEEDEQAGDDDWSREQGLKTTTNSFNLPRTTRCNFVITPARDGYNLFRIKIVLILIFFLLIKSNGPNENNPKSESRFIVYFSLFGYIYLNIAFLMFFH
jgi:hypothetical protein